MSGRLPARVRQLALAAALLAGCWLASQAVVLAWVAASAQPAPLPGEARSAWRHWDFATRASVVAPGSSGLEGARHAAAGLELPADDTAVDLSLPMSGQQLPSGTAFAVELRLHGTAPVEVQLLGAAEGADAVLLARAAVADAGIVRWDITTAQPAGVLRLRVERGEPAAVVLQSLSLAMPPRCAADALEPDCRHWRQDVTLGWAATPERLLARRDAARARWPLVDPTLRGVPATVGRSVAWVRDGRTLPLLALMGAAGVLGWSIRARWRGERSDARQLLPLLAVPVLLLACGWPRDDLDPAVAAAFAVSLGACFVHPGGARDWRWLGAPAAWRQAALLAAAGVALIVGVAAIGPSAPGLSHPAPGRGLRYLPWTAIQQALLLLVILPRLAAKPGRSPATACWLAGGVFALLHLPNFGLMAATLFAGAAFAWAGRRHPALLPLVAVHWLLGSALAWLATPWLLRNAEVGGRYLMGAG